MIIILAISIIGIVTTLFLNLSLSSMYLYNYQISLENKTKAYYLSKSALKIVKEYFKNKDTTNDNLKELWAYQYPISLDEATITIEIIDENRKIPIIFFKKDEQYQKVAYRLFSLLNINEQKGRKLEYILENQKFNIEDIKELLFFDFDKNDLYGKEQNNKIYPGLIKELTPYELKININTADKYVLMALSKDISEQLALNIIQARKEKPFKSIYDLLTVEGMNSNTLYKISKFIDVKSSIFKVKIEININDSKNFAIAEIEKKGKDLKLISWSFR